MQNFGVIKIELMLKYRKEQLTNAIGDNLYFIFLREAIKANLNNYSPLKMKLNGN